MTLDDLLRTTAARSALWVLARSGDPLAQVLEPDRDTDAPALYERMRARGPVHRSRTGSLIVTSHALCSAVLRDPRFRVRDSAGRPAEFDPLSPDVGSALTGSFLEQDPPDHTRLRRLVAPAFRPRLVRGYRERITATAHELLETAARRGTFDLVADLAAPLPIRVITDLLGVPDVDVERFARYGAVVGSALGGIWSARQAAELRAATGDLEALFVRLHRERAGAPGDDVLSLLGAAHGAGQLDLTELVAACGLLLIAGFETTVNLIGNAVVALHDHPEQWALLRAEPDRAVAAVEETLRYDPPVQLTVRVPHEEVELGGVRVGADQRVVLVLAAAGRDPQVHPDPLRFDITREQTVEHLAFGSGIHYCLGAPLARLEGEIALRVLAERLPELRVTGPLRHRPGGAIRGYRAVPLVAPAA